MVWVIATALYFNAFVIGGLLTHLENHGLLKPGHVVAGVIAIMASCTVATVVAVIG